MKKILFLGAIGALVAMPQHAYALTDMNFCFGAICENAALDGNFVPTNCAVHSDSCFKGTRIYSCDTCEDGYTRTLQSTTVAGCSGSITYYSCVREGGGDDGNDCDGICENCESSDWETLAMGYQQQIIRTCDTVNCICSNSYKYRCASGYYGTATMLSCMMNGIGGGYTCSTTDCQPCPAADGIYTDANRTTLAYGTVAAGNGNAKTGCYLPNGTYYDASGEFEISTPMLLQKCGYSE